MFEDAPLSEKCEKRKKTRFYCPEIKSGGGKGVSGWELSYNKEKEKNDGGEGKGGTNSSARIGRTRMTLSCCPGYFAFHYGPNSEDGREEDFLEKGKQSRHRSGGMRFPKMGRRKTHYEKRSVAHRLVCHSQICKGTKRLAKSRKVSWPEVATLGGEEAIRKSRQRNARGDGPDGGFQWNVVWGKRRKKLRLNSGKPFSKLVKRDG